MTVVPLQDRKTWTISEAKARLSEVLRLAQEEGAQYIGTKKTFVVIPEEEWHLLKALKEPKKPLGTWLIENMPTLTEFELPDRDETDREIPFQ